MICLFHQTNKGLCMEVFCFPHIAHWHKNRKPSLLPADCKGHHLEHPRQRTRHSLWSYNHYSLHTMNWLRVPEPLAWRCRYKRWGVPSWRAQLLWRLNRCCFNRVFYSIEESFDTLTWYGFVSLRLPSSQIESCINFFQEEKK
jgi:hypothetical protein